MRLDEITGYLDELFRIGAFEPDLPFSRLVPMVYEGVGIELERYLEGAFLQTFHGLMMRNGESVNMVRCIVFLSDEILGKVFARGERDVLLISHHPLVMETSDRGFLPLSEATLSEMQRRAISVYVLHTPLDVHGEISTSRALARVLGVEAQGVYCEGPSGPVGIYGHLPAPLGFDDFVARVASASGVDTPNLIRNRDAVHTVGIIGGGADVDDILETADLGCDTFVTGTYYNQVQNDIGQRYRDEFERVRDSLDINLIECSHYASEAVVMRQDMVDLCVGRFGVPCEFIPQDDPWY
jgi:putative NIF3 family GTP cyclohydrolase 1 type 2